MKNISGARLAAAVLIAGSCPAIAVPAGPPLKTLPLQQDIWIGGTIQQGNGQYAPGDYTTLLLDHPAASPCNDKVVTDILLGRAAQRTRSSCYLIWDSMSPSGGASSVRSPESGLHRRRTTCFRSTDWRQARDGQTGQPIRHTW